MSNENSLISTKDSKKVRKGETITELAHRHLFDQNHTTSDEEMQNVLFELSENVEVSRGNLYEMHDTTLIPALSGEAANNFDYKLNKDQKNSAPNPYDVLGG